jgi:serine O-acetyltransferase
MDDVLRADLYRYDGLTGRKGFWQGLSRPGFRYTYLFREISRIKGWSIKKKIYTRLIRYYQFKYGFQIYPGTDIGPGLFIGHFGALGINLSTKVGKNFTIMLGVTIGQANRGRLRGTPTIGDNVWIGAHGVVVGNIKIGNNVLIAPNSYVNFDVPDNSIVIGNPGKIIPHPNPTKDYILYVLDENGDTIPEEDEFLRD